MIHQISSLFGVDLKRFIMVATLAASIEVADPFHDSEAELIRKTNLYRSKNWFVLKEKFEALSMR